MLEKGSGVGFRRLIAILEGTGKSLLEIGITVAAAGLILGMRAVSWFGFSFSLALNEIVGNNFFLLLLLAAAGATLIGIGMAAYVPVALLISRALIEVGMIPLVARMFVFYFAVLSFLIPPLCLAVYTAALLAIVGIIVLSIAFEGFLLRHLHLFERLLRGMGIGLLMPSWSARGFVVVLSAVIWERQEGPGASRTLQRIQQQIVNEQNGYAFENQECCYRS